MDPRKTLLLPIVIDIISERSDTRIGIAGGLSAAAHCMAKPGWHTHRGTDAGRQKQAGNTGPYVCTLMCVTYFHDPITLIISIVNNIDIRFIVANKQKNKIIQNIINLQGNLNSLYHALRSSCSLCQMISPNPWKYQIHRGI